MTELFDHGDYRNTNVFLRNLRYRCNHRFGFIIGRYDALLERLPSFFKTFKRESIQLNKAHLGP